MQLSALGAAVNKKNINNNCEPLNEQVMVVIKIISVK